ncbi:MAG: dicarboxylate/amino acid:cation symporter [Desulfobacteraceae bacterium]|nr:dicarboxylate/amino acid:cation symporter [Desulfobacteraceae bacterium]
MGATVEVSKNGILGWYFQANLLMRILIGLALGALFGLAMGPKAAWVSPLGDIFVRLLKMIVMPVVISTLVVGAGSIHPKRLGKIGGKALIFYMLTSAVAVAVGLCFGNLFSPGKQMVISGMASAAGKELTRPSLIETLINVVPKNPFGAIAKGQILPVIFTSLLFGMGIAYLRESRDRRIKDAAQMVFQFFEGCAEVMYKIVHWVLEYAPIGVFALIAVVFGKQGATAFGPLAKVTMTVYLAFFAHIILVYGGALVAFRINFARFLSLVRPATITAFVTRSSSGTLPVSMEVAKDKMGVSKGIYSFTLPLGATINMDGTAIYQGVCAIFAGFAIGMPLTFGQQLTVIATAVLASIGTAGVPGAGAIMLLMVLDSIGLKVEPGSAVAAAYAMIFGIDALLDMGRTACNVTGDMAVSCIVAKTEGELDEKYWNGELTELKPAEEKI